MERGEEEKGSPMGEKEQPAYQPVLEVPSGR